MNDVLERGDAPSVVTAAEPVPPEGRVLSARHLAVLWGDLGIGLLVLVTGGLLVPALGFWTALAAIVLGSVIGVSLLAFAASVGAREGVATMVLFRSVLGTRGSWVPTVLNVAQLIGWTAVELWAISLVADLVAREVFGIAVRPLWLGLAAIVCVGLAAWGPVGVTRVWLGRFGAWMIVAISAVVTVLVLTADGLAAAIARPGEGGWPTFGLALDLVIAMPVSWLPLVADYTRFGTTPRAAARGTFWGYLVANVWLYSLGALLVLNHGAAPSPAGMAAGILAIAGGSVAGILFLVGLLAGETDEAFADIYSAAVSLQNIFSTVPQRVFIVAIGAVATALAGWLTMERYESFLFLLGSVFVPLFGVLVADRLKRRPTGLGSEVPAAGVRISALVAWIAGFGIYHWIVPTGPDWWSSGVSSVVGTPLSDRWSWLGASIPSFAISFALAVALTRQVSSRRPSGSSL